MPDERRHRFIARSASDIREEFHRTLFLRTFEKIFRERRRLHFLYHFVISVLRYGRRRDHVTAVIANIYVGELRELIRRSAYGITVLVVKMIPAGWCAYRVRFRKDLELRFFCVLRIDVYDRNARDLASNNSDIRLSILEPLEHLVLFRGLRLVRLPLDQWSLRVFVYRNDGVSADHVGKRKRFYFLIIHTDIIYHLIRFPHRALVYNAKEGGKNELGQSFALSIFAISRLC